MVHYINSKYALKGTFPLSRERSERENQQFRFYVWFQMIFNKNTEGSI
ncbi:MAG: hypothetical protein U5L45_11170 [Saprospiraceae bacterium]|nr:hypothetical protein [Saprospiraceae bacterium]